MKRIWHHKYRHTTLLLLGCLAFLLGTAAARSGQLIDASWWWASMPGLAFTFHRRRAWAVVWIIVFGLSLGWWRGSVYVQRLAAYTQLYNHKVTLVVRATNDAVYDKNKQLTFVANDIHVLGSGKPLPGKVNLSGFGLAAVFQGDSLIVAGKLSPTLGANQARMSYATMQILSHHVSLIDVLRRRFTAGVQSTLPEPLASFGMGLLIGQRNTLPDDVKQDLLMVGLTHIIAVSGYNLTIMLRAVKSSLGKRSKRRATLLSFALIGIFLLFAGTSASIVRAAVVSVLSLAAGYYGREVKPLLLIFLAAALTAFASPFYVWTDVSWYLSFLAFYGVMILAPMIARRLNWRWQKSLLAMIALESLCAEVMTLPFVLHTFGQMSFIALVANVLVVVLVPVAMLLTLVSGLAGMLLPALAGWLAWPATLLLTYMLDVAHLLSRIPGIFKQNIDFSTLQMLSMYALIVFISIMLWFKNKAKSGNITDEPLT